jgi:hypothetical protein
MGRLVDNNSIAGSVVVVALVVVMVVPVKSLKISGFDGVVIIEDEARGTLLLFDLIFNFLFNSAESK